MAKPGEGGATLPPRDDPDDAPASRPGVPPKPPAPRSVYAIQDDLTAARARHLDLMRANEKHHALRRRTLERFNRFVKEWPLTNDRPMEDDDVPDNCRVPAEDSPVGREFHEIHTVIRDLESELEAAKRR